MVFANTLAHTHRCYLHRRSRKHWCTHTEAKSLKSSRLPKPKLLRTSIFNTLCELSGNSAPISARSPALSGPSRILFGAHPEKLVLQWLPRASPLGCRRDAAPERTEASKLVFYTKTRAVWVSFPKRKQKDDRREPRQQHREETQHTDDRL